VASAFRADGPSNLACLILSCVSRISAMRSRLQASGLAFCLSLAAVTGFAPAAHAIERPVVIVVGAKIGPSWPAVGVIGVASALVTYDLIRRLTCTGDFLRLGGPGFGQAIGPNQNVLPPRICPPRP
jgi:hypothetical protein